MTTTYARYEDWLASLGNPQHHVLVGVDWWGCLCGKVEGSLHAAGANMRGGGHWQRHTPDDYSDPVRVEWCWGQVRDMPGSMADVHQALWEAEAF